MTIGSITVINARPAGTGEDFTGAENKKPVRRRDHFPERDVSIEAGDVATVPVKA